MSLEIFFQAVLAVCAADSGFASLSISVNTTEGVVTLLNMPLFRHARMKSELFDMLSSERYPQLAAETVPVTPLVPLPHVSAPAYAIAPRSTCS